MYKPSIASTEAPRRNLPPHGDRNALVVARERLPLPALLEVLGDAASAKRSAPCPFHQDKRNSFSVFRSKSGRWRWHCFAGCGGGDEVDYLAHRRGLSVGGAIREFTRLAGILEGGAK